MSTPLANKTALITGGSKGIGAATSHLHVYFGVHPSQFGSSSEFWDILARSGANVVINYTSDSLAADALAIKADAGSIPAIEHMVSKTVKRFGKIDILILCVGKLLMKDLEHTSEEDFDGIMRFTVKGPYFLAQKAAPHIPSDSCIVLTSTSQCTASIITPAYLLYNATKGAIEQMTRVMLKDLAAKGICVNAVALGPTGTDMFNKGKTEQVLKMIAGFSPMGRIGKPEEIAEAIVWFKWRA